MLRLARENLSWIKKNRHGELKTFRINISTHILGFEIEISRALFVMNFTILQLSLTLAILLALALRLSFDSSRSTVTSNVGQLTREESAGQKAA